MSIKVQGIKFYSLHELVQCVHAAHRIGCSCLRERGNLDREEKEELLKDINTIETITGIDIFEQVRSELDGCS